MMKKGIILNAREKPVGQTKKLCIKWRDMQNHQYTYKIIIVVVVVVLRERDEFIKHFIWTTYNKTFEKLKRHEVFVYMWKRNKNSKILHYHTLIILTPPHSVIRGTNGFNASYTDGVIIFVECADFHPVVWCTSEVERGR